MCSYGRSCDAGDAAASYVCEGARYGALKADASCMRAGSGVGGSESQP